MKIVWKYWYIIVILLVVGGASWWWTRPKAVEYEEYIVSRGDIREELTVSGEVKAGKQADLKFQAGGRLSWVGVKQGDWVKKWQGVASLDQRTVQKNLEKELNDYLKTRWDFQGNRETYNVATDNLDGYTLTPAVRRLLEKSQYLKYKLGMSGDGRLLVAEKTEVLILPAEAVSEKEGKKLVKQKAGKQAVEKEIMAGLETEERVEILGGLGEGDIVVKETNKE